MEYGILVLRAAIGLIVAAHGARKLASVDAAGDRFARIGYRAPTMTAGAVGGAELLGGILLAAGLVTPAAEALIATVMLMDIARFRRPSLRSVELNLAVLAAAVAVTMTGPLRLSIDAAIGWDEDVTGIGWAMGMLALAIGTAFVAITLGRARPEVTEIPA
jgi:putative oxidoreductase